MRLFVFATATLLPGSLALAGTDPPLEVRLVSENNAIAPGKVFRVGFQLVHPPGTHTYWKHPGIVGLPTTVEWELPPGFIAGEIQWPAPQLVKMGSHDAQGYEGETLLIVPVTPPSTFTGEPGEGVTLKAKVSWMCCGETCSPATKVPFSITLPTGGSPGTDPVGAPLFARHEARVPSPGSGWKSLSVKRGGGKITLALAPVHLGEGEGGKPGIRFFTADGQVDTDGEQTITAPGDGVVVLTLPVSKTGPENPTDLPGVLAITENGVSRFVEIKPAY